MQVQLAIFQVGEAEYALDIMRIKEVINPVAITHVPKAPSTIEGVIELRGAILPVVDLRKRFDLPVPETTRTTKIMLVKVETDIVGLVVDAVREVVRVPDGDIKPPPSMARAGGGWFTGVCRHDGRIVMLLDVDKILTTEEKIILGDLKGPPA